MIQKVLGQDDLFFSFYITVQVMAVSNMSSRDQDSVRTIQHSVQNKDRINPSGTHHPHRAQIVRILQAGYTSQISPGIRAPVAEKGHDFWFKLVHMYQLPSIFKLLPQARLQSGHP
jgi:hypothetical protein